MLAREERQCVVVDLPHPLSTNQIWRPIVRGKFPAIVKTKQYLEWESAAGLMLNTQKPGMVPGHFALHLYVSTKARTDLDNCLKAVLDLIQNHGLISNDRLCQSIRVKRADIDGMRVMIVSTSDGNQGRLL